MEIDALGFVFYISGIGVPEEMWGCVECTEIPSWRLAGGMLKAPKRLQKEGRWEVQEVKVFF